MLHQFYAVTSTSVYFVKDRRSKDDPRPFARKIALRGESEIAVGEELQCGTMIAIGKHLRTFTPKGGGRGKIEYTSTRDHGGHSSFIVALFTAKKKAISCLAHSGLQLCDPRWIEETRKIISRIGEDHPSFDVCKWGENVLLPS